MLRTLFIEEARTQVGRNASVTGACCLVLLGFLGLWWLLADVPALAGLMQLASMAVIIAIPVAVMVQVAVDYWQSMYGQRGYLTMAVPVRGRVHFAAKALYACVVVSSPGAPFSPTVSGPPPKMCSSRCSGPLIRPDRAKRPCSS